MFTRSLRPPGTTQNASGFTQRQVAARPMQHFTVLKSCSLIVERKSFRVELQQNHLGRCVRITEQAGSQKSAVMIPVSGLKSIVEVLRKIVHADEPSSGQD